MGRTVHAEDSVADRRLWIDLSVDVGRRGSESMGKFGFARDSPNHYLLAAVGSVFVAICIENFLFLVLCSGQHMVQASLLYLARAIVCVVIAVMAARFGSPLWIFAGETMAAIASRLFRIPSGHDA